MQRLFWLVLAISAVLIISRLLRATALNRVQEVESKYRVRKAVNFVTFLAIVIAVLMVYSDRLGGLGVALGVAGAGIAFALQELIISIAGWVLIVTTNIIKVGQRVQINGIRGDVVDIGVLKTTLMEVGEWVGGDLYNGRIVNVANSFAFKEPVYNYSGEYPFLWDEVRIPVRYGSDHEAARKLFLTTLQQVTGDYALASSRQWHHLADRYRVEKAQVEPMVDLEFDENWITYTLRYIVDYKKRRSTKNLIFTAILDALPATEGKVVIACSTLEVSLTQ